MSGTRAQRRRPTIATEWQLAVLRQLQSESGNPTEEQRSAVAAETGLDEKWVKNWFTRQRSKLAARNRKGTPFATVPTFKLQLSYSPDVLTSRRSTSTSTEPSTPNRSGPAILEPASSRTPRSTVDIDALPRSHRSVSAPVYSIQNNSLVNTTHSLHATTMPTYSRDPLCNRYPDFSQFFRPQAHQRSYALELSTRVDGHSYSMSLLANSNMAAHAPMRFQGLPSSLPALSPCPVAFSMRLVDLFSHH